MPSIGLIRHAVLRQWLVRELQRDRNPPAPICEERRRIVMSIWRGPRPRSLARGGAAGHECPPGLRCLAVQFRRRTRIVEHARDPVVGEGRLCPLPGRGSVRCHSPDAGQAIPLYVRRAGHHPNFVDQFEQVALKQLDGIDDDDALPAARFLDTLLYCIAYRRMHDTLQPFELDRIGEDEAGEVSAIDRPIRADYTIAERQRYLRRGRRARPHQVVHHGVRVDALVRAQLEEDISYRRLAAADRPGDAEDARRSARTASTHCRCASSRSVRSSS